MSKHITHAAILKLISIFKDHTEKAHKASRNNLQDTSSLSSAGTTQLQHISFNPSLRIKQKKLFLNNLFIAYPWLLPIKLRG